MILTLDVGNSQIFGGVFHHQALTLRFRKPASPSSSDELGLFLRSVLRENGADPAAVEDIAFCSVLPEIIYSLRSCCRKYFGLDPFILRAGVKTGLKIRYRNPLEVGPDRIANAVGATHLYPGRHLIIVDLGTATTFNVVSASRDYLRRTDPARPSHCDGGAREEHRASADCRNRPGHRACRPVDDRVYSVGPLPRAPRHDQGVDAGHSRAGIPQRSRGGHRHRWILAPVRIGAHFRCRAAGSHSHRSGAGAGAE